MISNGFDDILWLAGHGPYVWTSLGICVAVVLIERLALRRARARALSRVRRLHQSRIRKFKQ